MDAQETVVLSGHIIDSLILAKVLDTILMLGGRFDLTDVKIGATRDEPSSARIRVRAASGEQLQRILDTIQPHGATTEQLRDCVLERAPADGVLPDRFYATTHLPTQVRLRGRWVEVDGIEMDVSIRVRMENDHVTAAAVPMGEVRAGDFIVTGRDGIRVTPLERPQAPDVFGFMQTQVSAERPHIHIIWDIARRMETIREQRGAQLSGAVPKILLAGGPAIIHAGGRDALTWLIDNDFVHVLFAGNALAVHDMEAHLFGTSLGYRLAGGQAMPHGHENHLRTINRIRALGSIEAAVQSGVIASGIMAACIRRRVHMVLAGTIRDDGPLPDVITDAMKAQAAMRAALRDVRLALLVASTLHAVATGNLLPARIPTVCVDINPAVPTKLADRGSFQAVGLVMDAASFLRELARELGWKA
jgi:lysine-ketoglutarate reductase/saccharopine dehydrogenase-like protein (TIGR00300 family)